MSKFAILLAGDVVPSNRLTAQLTGCRVIAADSGIKHAASLGLEPELWVGDFDSTPTALRDEWHRVEQQRHPAAKDQTDGALAVEAAVKRGASEIILVGAFGGQFDHAAAHMTMLLMLAQQGFKASATSGNEEAWPLLKSLSLWQIPRGTRLSVIALSPLVGLSILGVRWPLQQRDVELGSTLTLSNESTGDVAMTLQQGRAVVLLYPKVSK
jgi:thiamine pyrophosphokinase